MGCFSIPKGVPDKHYTGEFKQMVAEAIIKDKMSYREAAKQFEVSNHHLVADWERIYLMEGPSDRTLNVVVVVARGIRQSSLKK